MHNLFSEMLAVMDAAFCDFNGSIQKPRRVGQKDGWAYRFESKDIYHAVVLKLAMIQSSLRAAKVLNESGYLLEQAMLQRIIEDANDDVLFLVLAITDDVITPLHERYLESFWKEEDFPSNPSPGSNTNPDIVSRKKIRAYIARFQKSGGDPSRTVELSKFIHRMYSGFVHGASPHIMELYVGWPPNFHTHGLLGTPRVDEYQQDLWNYMYRGLLSHILVAKLFGSQQHVDELIKHKRRFEALAGKNY